MTDNSTPQDHKNDQDLISLAVGREVPNAMSALVTTYVTLFPTPESERDQTKTAPLSYLTGALQALATVATCGVVTADGDTIDADTLTGIARRIVTTRIGEERLARALVAAK